MSMRAVAPGMSVISADGHALGHVVRVSDDGAFEVEHGFWFPRDSVVEPAQVAAIEEGAVRLKGRQSEILMAWRQVEMFGDRKALARQPYAAEGEIPERLPLEPLPHHAPHDAGLDRDPLGPEPSPDGDQYRF